MKNKKIIRTFAATLAVMLCFAAFSTTAFAGGADPDPAPLPEETGTPTTGGIELDTEDAEGGNDTSSTTEDKESTGAAETMTDEEMAELLSSLLPQGGAASQSVVAWSAFAISSSRRMPRAAAAPSASRNPSCASSGPRSSWSSVRFRSIAPRREPIETGLVT